LKTTLPPFNPIALSSQALSGQRQFQLRDQPDSQNQLTRNRSAVAKPVAKMVCQGEVLKSESYQKYYRPQFNQQVAPQNQSAINIYQSTSMDGSGSRSVGLILDRYI